VQNKKLLFGKIARPTHVHVGADPRVCPIKPDNTQQIQDNAQQIPDNEKRIPDNEKRIQDNDQQIPDYKKRIPDCKKQIPDNDPPIPFNNDPQLTLNDAGKMIEKWFLKLETKFPDIQCDVFIVMPNHVHCIIVNNGTGNSNIARANHIKNDPNLDRLLIDGEASILDEPQNLGGLQNLGEPQNLGKLSKMGELSKMAESSIIMGEHMGSPLSSVMQWFKTMSTNEYILGVKTLDWERFDGKLWQRNYWEHIIRDERSYNAIRKYIINNPRKWDVDKLR
jgi:hypothetical protein